MNVTEIKRVISQMQKNLECAICLNLVKCPVSTKCDHQFCRFCLFKFLDSKPCVPCPLCKVPITKRGLRDRVDLDGIVNNLKVLAEAFEAETKQSDCLRLSTSASSLKKKDCSRGIDSQCVQKTDIFVKSGNGGASSPRRRLRSRGRVCEKHENDSPASKSLSYESNPDILSAAMEHSSTKLAGLARKRRSLSVEKYQSPEIAQRKLEQSELLQCIEYGSCGAVLDETMLSNDCSNGLSSYADVQKTDNGRKVSNQRIRKGQTILKLDNDSNVTGVNECQSNSTTAPTDKVHEKRKWTRGARKGEERNEETEIGAKECSLVESNCVQPRSTTAKPSPALSVCSMSSTQQLQKPILPVSRTYTRTMQDVFRSDAGRENWADMLPGGIKRSGSYTDLKHLKGLTTKEKISVITKAKKEKLVKKTDSDSNSSTTMCIHSRITSETPAHFSTRKSIFKSRDKTGEKPQANTSSNAVAVDNPYEFKRGDTPVRKKTIRNNSKLRKPKVVHFLVNEEPNEVHGLTTLENISKQMPLTENKLRKVVGLECNEIQKSLAEKTNVGPRNTMLAVEVRQEKIESNEEDLWKTKDIRAPNCSNKSPSIRVSEYTDETQQPQMFTNKVLVSEFEHLERGHERCVDKLLTESLSEEENHMSGKTTKTINKEMGSIDEDSSHRAETADAHPECELEELQRTKNCLSRYRHKNLQADPTKMEYTEVSVKKLCRRKRKTLKKDHGKNMELMKKEMETVIHRIEVAEDYELMFCTQDVHRKIEEDERKIEVVQKKQDIITAFGFDVSSEENFHEAESTSFEPETEKNCNSANNNEVNNKNIQFNNAASTVREDKMQSNIMHESEITQNKFTDFSTLQPIHESAECNANITPQKQNKTGNYENGLLSLNRSFSTLAKKRTFFRPNLGVMLRVSVSPKGFVKCGNRNIEEAPRSKSESPQILNKSAHNTFKTPVSKTVVTAKSSKTEDLLAKDCMKMSPVNRNNLYFIDHRIDNVPDQVNQDDILAQDSCYVEEVKESSVAVTEVILDTNDLMGEDVLCSQSFVADDEHQQSVFHSLKTITPTVAETQLSSQNTVSQSNNCQDKDSLMFDSLSKGSTTSLQWEYPVTLSGTSQDVSTNFTMRQSNLQSCVRTSSRPRSKETYHFDNDVIVLESETDGSDTTQKLISSTYTVAQEKDLTQDNFSLCRDEVNISKTQQLETENTRKSRPSKRKSANDASSQIQQKNMKDQNRIHSMPDENLLPNTMQPRYYFSDSDDEGLLLDYHAKKKCNSIDMSPVKPVVFGTDTNCSKDNGWNLTKTPERNILCDRVDLSNVDKTIKSEDANLTKDRTDIKVEELVNEEDGSVIPLIEVTPVGRLTYSACKRHVVIETLEQGSTGTHAQEYSIDTVQDISETMSCDTYTEIRSSNKNRQGTTDTRRPLRYDVNEVIIRSGHNVNDEGKNMDVPDSILEAMILNDKESQEDLENETPYQNIQNLTIPQHSTVAATRPSNIKSTSPQCQDANHHKTLENSTIKRTPRGLAKRSALGGICLSKKHPEAILSEQEKSLLFVENKDSDEIILLDGAKKEMKKILTETEFEEEANVEFSSNLKELDASKDKEVSGKVGDISGRDHYQCSCMVPENIHNVNSCTNKEEHSMIEVEADEIGDDLKSQLDAAVQEVSFDIGMDMLDGEPVIVKTNNSDTHISAYEQRLNRRNMTETNTVNKIAAQSLDIMDTEENDMQDHESSPMTSSPKQDSDEILSQGDFEQPLINVILNESEDDDEILQLPKIKMKRQTIESDSDDSKQDDEEGQQDLTNYTSSTSAISSQSEILTTPLQEALEGDLVKLHQEIEQYEAKLKTKISDVGENCKNGTILSRQLQYFDPPDDGNGRDNVFVIDESPADPKVDDDEDSDDLFVSPSPPPPLHSKVSVAKKPALALNAAHGRDEILKQFQSPSGTIRVKKSLDFAKKSRHSECTETIKTNSIETMSQVNTQIEEVTVSCVSEELPVVPGREHATDEVNTVDLIEESGSESRPASPVISSQRQPGGRFPQPSDACGNRAVHNKGTKSALRRELAFVASGLSKEQGMTLMKLVNDLSVTFCPKFVKNVTHVIMRPDEDGGRVCERTLKFFHGIANKCWIVNFQWVTQSLAAGYLLPETEYEITGDTIGGEETMGPMKSRLSKTKLFSTYSFACVGNSNEMPKESLYELLSVCGASVVDSPVALLSSTAKEKLIVRCTSCDEEPTVSEMDMFNGFFKHMSLQTVMREWVLDSLGSYNLLPLSDYSIIS